MTERRSPPKLPPPPRRIDTPPIKATMPAPPVFGGDEPKTGRRNPNVSLMQQLISAFDELDDHNRELLVCVAHEILTSQNKRAF